MSSDIREDMKDAWKPDQYNKFKNQRAQPFWDLLDLTNPEGVKSVIDLGCGTGELTKEMLSRFPHAQVLGVDSSAAMLKETAKLENERLRFQLEDINTFAPSKKYDLVFSNATLQWLPEHEELFPKVLSWVADHGQVAIQMPYNFDHSSHQIADQVAKNFKEFKGNPPALRILLPWSDMQKCFIKRALEISRVASRLTFIRWRQAGMLSNGPKELFLLLTRKPLRQKNSQSS